MFSFFRKKRKERIDMLLDTLDERSVNGVAAAAKTLMAQLMMSTYRHNYVDLLKSNFVRGYLFGYFDAAIQRMQLPCQSENDALFRIIAGHYFLFYDQRIDVIEYVQNSIDLQFDSEYKQAHELGVKELFGMYDNEERPLSLMQYIVEQK